MRCSADVNQAMGFAFRRGQAVDGTWEFARNSGRMILTRRTVPAHSIRIFTGDPPHDNRRRELVDVSVTPWYHCITRCVRRALLLGEGLLDRKEWVEDRIEELAEIFAVGVGGFSVMDNHLHLLVRLDPEVAEGWSDEEVVRRWGSLFPPRDKSRQPLPVSEEWVQGRLKDVPWVAKTRERLQSISWFMKCLKEPISRLANREDKCRGAFCEARFKSVAILDEEALLAASTYIDLNPVAAGIADGSRNERVHVDQAARRAHQGSGQDGGARSGQRRQRGGFRAAGGLEEGLWLCPIEDRRRLDSTRLKACSRDSRSAIISCWLTIPGGCFARGRPGYRRSWPGFLIGLEVAPRAGKSGWKSSGMADRSAVSLRPAGRSCEPWPSD